MQFLAMSLDHLPVNYRYSTFEDETEPLRYPNYEESKKEMQQWLEQMKQALEQADDENREQIAESVKSLEEYLESIDETEWMVSPASIAAYQGRVQWVEALNYDFTSSLVGNDEGEGGYYDLSDNYSRGTLSAEELLSTIDKKVQMMRLEGD